jgi:hypothetical protein
LTTGRHIRFDLGAIWRSKSDSQEQTRIYLSYRDRVNGSTTDKSKAARGEGILSQKTGSRPAPIEGVGLLFMFSRFWLAG